MLALGIPLTRICTLTCFVKSYNSFKIGHCRWIFSQVLYWWCPLQIVRVQTLMQHKVVPNECTSSDLDVNLGHSQSVCVI